jgi:hypothetical protein
LWQEQLQRIWTQEVSADDAIKEVQNRAMRLMPPKDWLQ